MNFWTNLKKPIFALAPMEDVTDTVFRQIVLKCSKPDVLFTEFTSIDGILSEKGSKHVAQRLKYTSPERPLVAQIWGNDPEKFYQVAKLLKVLGFDGIDINMGCPASTVIKKKSCSYLIKNPELAGQIIESTIKGGGGLPISVKTRLGFNDIQTEEWIGFLLSLPIAAITIHARTVKEMSKVPSHWDEIGKAVKLRDKMGSNVLILGNGDITSAREANELIKKYEADGAMIGRGVFKDLWIFNKKAKKYQATLNEKLELLLMHAKLFESTWGKTKNFAILRKFFKSYVSEFEGASDLRVALLQTNSFADVKQIVNRNKAVQKLNHTSTLSPFIKGSQLQ